MKAPRLPFFFALLTAAAIPVSLADDKATPDKPAAKDKPYPLETCIVSDEKLGDMGEPYVFSYKGQEIKMCCKSCNKDFTKAPEKYLKKIADAKKPKS